MIEILTFWLYFVCSVMFLLCSRARDALWSPAGKGLTSWLSFVMSNCEVVTFPNILGQVWCLIASIPDICPLSYFYDLNVSFGNNTFIRVRQGVTVCVLLCLGCFIGPYLQ